MIVKVVFVIVAGYYYVFKFYMFVEVGVMGNFFCYFYYKYMFNILECFYEKKNYVKLYRGLKCI